jgi:hypothetical protein
MSAFIPELLCVAVGLLLAVWAILFAVLLLQDFVPLVLSGLRRIFCPFRFTLRTLLLTAGAIQVMLGVYRWQSENLVGSWILLPLGAVSLTGWMLSICLADALRPTIARKYRRIGTPDRVSLPPGEQSNPAMPKR